MWGLNMKMVLFASALFVSAVSVSPALALGEQWYGFYMTKGGLQISVGPFDNRFSCEAAKYKIPFGATWMGCRS